MVILKEITLKNFKSFRGETKVDVPLFAAIVGSNGAGKSNFIDAVCFTTGVSSRHLRVSRLQELVYRSNSGEYEQNMLVSVVLQTSDGALTFFERSFQLDCCQYRINGNVVSHSDYVEALKRLGINSKIKNFVVFQNSIESIITKTPMQRTAMFEEISGSGCHIAEYKRLVSQVLQMEQELQCLYQSRRSISAELKRMLYSRENAHEYQSLERKYDKAQVHLLLFNLHCAERNIRQWSETIEEIDAKILALESEKDAVVERLNAAKETIKISKLKAAFAEPNVKVMEIDLSNMVNDYLAIEAEVKYAQNKVASCRASLESARKDDEARAKSVERLREALKRVEKTKDDHSQRYSQMLAIDSGLLESQHEEYERLRGLCLEKFAADHQRLMFLEREYNSVEDELEVAKRKKNELQSSVDRNCALRAEIFKRAKNLEKTTKEIERELEMKRECQRELHKSMELAKANTRALTKELEDIARQIGDVKLDEQFKEKYQVVNDLKRLYPGVLDRLRNMCHPIHDRYNVVVTKVLGPHSDSIVVDTSETATLCIQYLKDRNIGIDTFLPLDDIAAKPIKQQLRDIRSPSNVKLVFDVIAFDSRIDRVIQFVTDNTLISDTPEHAAEIAFKAQKPHDCVSVDGTLFRTSGLITGGSHDTITTKAQRCDSSFMMKLLMRKAELIGALREIRHKLPKESDLSILDSRIRTLYSRLEEYSDYHAAISQAKRVSDFQFEIQNLEDELDTSMNKSDEVELRMDQLSKEIDELKSKIIEEEKEFYADFCKSIGLDDIRHYENRQKLCKEEMQNFRNQIDCIKRQLDFEMTRDTAKNVSRWERNLREAESALESRLEQERDKRDKIERFKKRAQDSAMQYTSIQKGVEEVENESKKLRSQVDAISKELMNLSRQRSAMQLLIEKKKAHRHTLLTDAKVHGLNIPLINEPPNNSPNTSNSLDRSPSTIDSNETYELENNVHYDFSKLPSDLLKLESPIDIRAAREKLERSVSEIAAAMDELADPNMKASQQAQMLKEELAKTKSKIQQASKKLRKTVAEFARVKADRYGKFMEFFEHAVDQVDVIYKKLTRSSSAQAIFVPENPEEPYLGGIHFHCIAPGKRYQCPSALSGGEKTLAALSLIFSAHSKSPSFKVLDEVDTALDSKGTTKVMKYLDGHKGVQQSIVISHKKEIFAGADALLGIYSVRSDHGPKSGILSFDLSCYQR